MMRNKMNRSKTLKMITTRRAATRNKHPQKRRTIRKNKRTATSVRMMMKKAIMPNRNFSHR